MKVIAILAIVLCMAIPAIAEQTTHTEWQSEGIGGFTSDQVNEFLTESGVLNHRHEVREDKKLHYGIGLDVVVWENEKETPVLQDISVQGRYTLDKDTDIDKGDTAVYLVARVNMFNLFKGK